MLSNRMVGVLSAKRFCVSSPQKRCNHFGGAKLSCGEIVSSYMEVKQYVDFLNNSSSKPEVPLSVESKNSPLLAALQTMWSPACVTGTVGSWTHYTHESLVRRLSPQELLGFAGSDTPMSRIGTNFIEPSWLDRSSLSRIARSCDSADIGTHTEAVGLAVHSNSTDTFTQSYTNHTVCDDIIGKLVIIMGSEYTGGEMEVTHEGNTATISGPWSWFACNKDCKLNFKPVTSGTRELLIYDIISKPSIDGAPRLVRDSSRRDFDLSRVFCESNDEDIHVDHESHSRRKQTTATLNLNTFKRCTTLLYNNVPLPAIVQNRIISDIRDELRDHDSIIIAFDNLYTAPEVNFTHLKGGDRALYDLLSQQYNVDFVSATIYRDRGPVAALFSTDIMRASLSKHRKDCARSTTGKILLPHKLRQEHVLDEIVNMYIVSALRVSAK